MKVEIEGAEETEVFTPVKKRVIKVEAGDLEEAAWDTQFWLKTNDVLHAGDTYELSYDSYAFFEASVGTQLHKNPGEYVHWAAVGNFAFGPEWETHTATGTIPSEGEGTFSIALNINDKPEANTYYFANLSLKINGVEQLNNGDLSSDDNSSFFTKENQGATVNSTILNEYLKREVTTSGGVSYQEVTKTFDKRVIKVAATEKVTDPWDNQFWIVANNPFNAGDTWEVSMEIRADKEATPGTQIHKKTPGEYLHWAAIGSPTFGEDWSVYKNSGTIPAEGAGGQSIAFNLNDFADANKYYFGKISLKVNGVEQVNNVDLKSNDVSSFYEKLAQGTPGPSTILDGYDIEEEIKSTIPLTPEEKRDTLVYAMKYWIDAIMDATEGKVKSWDLINEAISGGGDVNGYYDLQHTNPEAPSDFFWQDYFGSENYGVIVEKLAREAYARQEGANPADLKLFINDYNLEATWDDNKKLESLIYWIGVWEKGGAKIDGIGSQMHINYFLDAKDQENQKKHITSMLEKMAATGKLVRISELDMGVAKTQSDAFAGNVLSSKQMTLEIEKAMADYYQWIIEEYFRVVPVPQQYGICQWCLTDASASSGWRADEPVGLWFLDYTRKPAYAGWAEGLKK